jgi:hypothetical protein
VSLRRYLITVWFIIMVALLLVVAAAWEPGLAPGWETRLAIGLPVVAGGIAASLRRAANRTPPEARTSFWAYRDSNWVLALFGAALVVAGIGVMI